ncbi:MAG: hypothetical protein AAF289_12365 [Cyanobacteria bacterium P01_A01_bin.135]
MTAPSLSQSDADAPAWESLKKAIANSSGFQRWQLQTKPAYADAKLDDRVVIYLRETLETLAY